MHLRRLIVVLFFAFLPITTAHAIQDEAPPEKVETEQVEAGDVEAGDVEIEGEEMVFPAGDMGDHFLQMQNQAVDAELGKLQAQLDFDDEWKAKTKAALKSEIERTAKRMADANDMMAFSFSNSVDDELQNKILELVANELPDEKKEAFANYKATELQFRQLKIDIGINGVMVFLDNHLCLSISQFETLRKQFSENWQWRFNDIGGMTAINGLLGGKQILEIVENDIWKKTLTEKQFEVYEGLDQNSNLMMAIQMSAIGGEDDSFSSERVKELCDEAFALKFDEYETLIGLDEKQRKLLSVAKKGASGKVVQRWAKIMEDVGGDINGMGMNMDLMIEAMEPVISKCTRQTVWRKSLAKVFDEQQMELINKRESTRRELAMNQLLNYLVFSMTGQATQLGLDMEQHKQFVDLVRSELDSDQVNYMEVINGLYEIEEADFQEVLTDEQWEKFRPVWEQQKQMMDQQAAASGEDEDEDDN